MLFCPKCSGLMVPKKEGKKTIMFCPKCNYKSKKETETTIKETIKEEDSSKMRVDIVEEEPTAHPVVDKTCPKCGNDKAQFWEVQTRAPDEPATQFFKCTKCGHTWRHYD